MTLQIDDLAVWLPTRGTVLRHLTAELSGVTLVVGRNGRGATTLLRALAGRSTPGTRIAGEVALDGRRIDTLTAAELGEDVAWGSGDDPFGDPRGLTPRLLVLDQPLLGLTPERRTEFCARVRAHADAGAVVVWAEHLIEEALVHCDHVVEIVGDDTFWFGSRAEWNPRTLPAPPAMALARGLDLPRSTWFPASGDSLISSAVTPHLRTPRRAVNDQVAEAAPRLSRVDRPLALRGGECLGIVDLDGDRTAEIDLARRLVTVARGEELLAEPLTLPRAARVDDLTRAWERRHGLAPGSVASYAAGLAHLDPTRSVDRHSSGEQAALAWALTALRPGARLLVDPTHGMDPAARRLVARTLQADQGALTCLVSSDVEVLTRACHRLVLIRGGVVVADGAPLALLDQLPHRPQLARLGGRALRVADLLPTPPEARR